MLYLSKSRYCRLWQCPKMLWLDTYRPELKAQDDAKEARFAVGNEVGDLAMGLFGDFVEVTAKKEDGRLDLPEMIRRTEEEMKKRAPVICEASFSFGGLYCAVDLLKKENGGWAIYEVKSATHVSSVYCADVAYQKYVLENCGVKVTGVYVVTINGGYVFDGTRRLDELFNITDVSDGVAEETMKIEANLRTAEQVLAGGEPTVDIGEYCKSPYECEYWDYCTRALQRPNVFDLYRIGFKTALKHYFDGVTSYDALLAAGKVKNKTALRQIDFALNDRGTFADRDAIRAFLDTLSYPLYFLDFETMQLPVPKYVGTRPYQQVPFQYSLHYIEKEGGELKHKEFLAESGPDPRRALAERLCADIPKDVCVTAYNKAFECIRIKELAAAFPDLSEHLLNIESNIKDLLLPALFPDDPQLNYHNLEGVHNGSEAMDLFPQIQFMEPAEKETARRNLLKYCELDTLAMVKVWEKLKIV